MIYYIPSAKDRKQYIIYFANVNYQTKHIYHEYKTMVELQSAKMMREKVFLLISNDESDNVKFVKILVTILHKLLYKSKS